MGWNCSWRGWSQHHSHGELPAPCWAGLLLPFTFPALSKAASSQRGKNHGDRSTLPSPPAMCSPWLAGVGYFSTMALHGQLRMALTGLGCVWSLPLTRRDEAGVSFPAQAVQEQPRAPHPHVWLGNIPCGGRCWEKSRHSCLKCQSIGMLEEPWMLLPSCQGFSKELEGPRPLSRSDAALERSQQCLLNDALWERLFPTRVLRSPGLKPRGGMRVNAGGFRAGTEELRWECTAPFLPFPSRGREMGAGMRCFPCSAHS